MLLRSLNYFPALCSMLLAVTAPAAFAQARKSMLVAEPVHNVGYLPLYVAIRKGYFEEAGLDVKVITIEGAAGHTNAVLSKQAFAFVGGPEHNAFAKLKGAELRAVVNCVNRGNVYLMAKKGVGPKSGQDLAEYMKGQHIAVGAYGGTPHSIMRYLLKEWKLDPKKDVVLQETLLSAILSAVKAGKTGVGLSSEPFVTRGITEGIWEGPIVSVPQKLGPYAYSTLNVRRESIQSEPDDVRHFVRGIIRGIKLMHAQKDEATKIARQEFPTMAQADLVAIVDRYFADNVWSKDGLITPAAWKTSEAVVLEAGVLKQSVPYDQVIDMQFVKAVLPTIQ